MVDGEIDLAVVNSASTRLSAGYSARIDARTHQVFINRQAHPEDAIAWGAGQLSYHGATLATIIEDLERYGAEPIRIDEPRLGELEFTGTLAIDSPRVMIERLCSLLPIRSEHDANGWIIRSKA